MKTYRVADLLGDGVGPEVVDATWKVLKAAEENAKIFRLDLTVG